MWYRSQLKRFVKQTNYFIQICKLTHLLEPPVKYTGEVVD
jgi:hypothetical protein